VKVADGSPADANVGFVFFSDPDGNGWAVQEIDVRKQFTERRRNVGKVRAGLFMSLDGVVEASDGWQLPYFNDEMLEAIDASSERTDAILLGRRGYLEGAELWPKWGSDVPGADFMNETPKYVVSSTLEEPLRWTNSSLLGGDLSKGLAKLKERSDKDTLIPGSPTLVRSLLGDGLLDELNLYILPIVIGSGMRLFDGMDTRVGLELMESKTFSNGALDVTYRPAGTGQ